MLKISSLQNSPGRTSCTPCAAATFAQLNATSECQKCAVGSASDAGAAACESCPAGRASGAGTACALCGPGFSSKGQTSSCDLCAAGESQFLRMQCGPCFVLVCISGRYAGGNGSTTCTVCVFGRAQLAPGQTDCNACAPGQAPVRREFVLTRRWGRLFQAALPPSTARPSALPARLARRPARASRRACSAEPVRLPESWRVALVLDQALGLHRPLQRRRHRLRGVLAWIRVHRRPQLLRHLRCGYESLRTLGRSLIASLVCARRPLHRQQRVLGVSALPVWHVPERTRQNLVPDLVSCAGL